MRFHYRLGWALLNFVLKALWGLKKRGTEYIPQRGGVIIASNHRAYSDPPLLGTAAPRELFYLAKKELFENKAFGWLIAKFNAIPIQRKAFDRKGYNTALELLKSGNALVLFPEGTRSKNGELLPPQQGVGKIALEAGVPIVPAYIRNSKNLFGNLFKRKRLVVKFGSPINGDWLNAIPNNKEGYKAIGEEIMRRIRLLKESNP